MLANPIKDRAFPTNCNFENHTAIIATQIEATTETMKEITGIPISAYFIENVSDSLNMKIMMKIDITDKAVIVLCEQQNFFIVSSCFFSR